jgi:hypothetical protein
MMSAADFTTWLDTSRPRDRFQYHEGVLAADRRDWTDRSRVAHKALPGLNALAKAVTKAADQGLVALLQHRLGKGRFSYEAIRLPAPLPRVIPQAARAGSVYSSRNRGVVWHGRIAA